MFTFMARRFADVGVFHRAVNATFEQVPIPLFVVNNVHIA